MEKAKIEKFEDIIAWQKSKAVALYIYQLLGNNRDFSFKDQIQRAAVSIPKNIAEGYERKSIKNLNSFYILPKVHQARSVRCFIWVWS